MPLVPWDYNIISFGGMQTIHEVAAYLGCLFFLYLAFDRIRTFKNDDDRSEVKIKRILSAFIYAGFSLAIGLYIVGPMLIFILMLLLIKILAN